MNPLFVAASEVQAILNEEHVPFCVIGGLAVIRWGEIRVTQDVDLTVLGELGRERELIDRIVVRLRPRIDDATVFARKNRVLLLSASNGVPIDISLGALPYELKLVKRSSLFAFAPKCTVRTCSADDLIVMKAFASRDRDWADISGVIARQGDSLDWRYIGAQLEELCAIRNDTLTVPRLLHLRKATGRKPLRKPAT